MVSTVSRGSKARSARSGPANQDVVVNNADNENANNNNNLPAIPENQAENHPPEADMEQPEHQSAHSTNPVAGIDPAVLQQLLNAALQSANEMYRQREKALMDILTGPSFASHVYTGSKRIEL